MGVEDPDALTTEQVASVLGVTTEAVRAWIRRGRLQGGWLYGSRKLGYRIARVELVRFLRDNNQPVLADRVETGELPVT